MSSSQSQSRKSTKTSTSTKSETQSISDSYNQTLSVVNNSTYGALPGAEAVAGNTKLLIYAGLGLGALLVLGLAMKG
jgi:hypothetical protein